MRAIILGVVLWSGMSFGMPNLGSADAFRAEETGAKARMLVDFDETNIRDRLIANNGVSLSITEPDPITGKRALEVHVAPFSVHKNTHPYLVFGPRFFTSPVDVSSYSRLSVPITNIKEDAFKEVQVQWSTLPDNDHGRNMEGGVFSISGGNTSDCSVRTDSFEINDPSSITLLYIIFRPSETATVYRIDAIQAVYDPTLGSPAEKLQAEVRELEARLETLKLKLNWSGIPENMREKWQQELSILEVKVQEIAATCAQAGSPAFRGRHNAAKDEVADVTRRMGEFFFADKTGFVAWEIDPYVNIVKKEYPDFNRGEVEKIEVQMAGNEFRNYVFMVSPCDKGLKLAVKVEANQGLPASAVEIFETRYLRNRLNQETGEPLYPMDEPLAIPSGESRQITLRFNNRTETIMPGTHPFQVILRDLDTGVEKVIPGTLEVWDFVLPDYDILPNNGYVEFDSSEFSQGKLLALAVADMKNFGFNIVSIHPTEMPRITEVDAEGRVVKIDSTAFEARLSQVVKAWEEAPGQEKLQFLFSISGMYDLGVKGLDQPLPNARWQKVLVQWLGALTATLQEYNLTYADWVMAVGDEANELALINNEIPAAEGLKAADPRVRTINNTSTPLSDPTMTRRFYRAFDVLQPHLPAFKSRPAMRNWIQASELPVWTYQCLPHFGARGKNTYEYYRVYGWDLVKQGITGIGVWTYCAQAQSQMGSGYIMIYKHADRDEVLHSRRYEFLREGMDDYRYLWKLKQTAKAKGAAAVQETDKLIQEAVADVTTHPDDSSRADHWRTRIAAEIVQLQNN